MRVFICILYSFQLIQFYETLSNLLWLAELVCCGALKVRAFARLGVSTVEWLNQRSLITGMGKFNAINEE